MRIVRRMVYRHRLLRLGASPLRVFTQALRKRCVSRDRVREHISALFPQPVLLSIDEFEGCYVVDPRSDIFSRLLLDGCYEPVLAEVCKRLVDADRDVIDIGANVGFFSILCAKHTTKAICAVEPMSNVASLLKENIARNKVADRVSVWEGVISDTSGETAIEYVPGREEYSSLVGIRHPSTRTAQILTRKVASITLDELISAEQLDPGFIKIDAEGAEDRIFSGARKTLSAFRPIILSEFSPYLLRRSGGDPERLLRTVRDHEYHLLDPLMPDLKVGARDFGDLLAVPQEYLPISELLQLVRASSWDAMHRSRRTPATA